MKYINIILFKTWADLRAEASRAYIGFIWWFLEPLLYMSAFYLIFGLGLRMGGEGFIYFLLAGLVPWKWFSSTVANGSRAIEAGAGMIHQVYIPKLVLPSIIVAVNTVKFLMILPLLIGFLLINREGTQVNWVMLFPLVLLQLLFIWSVAALSSAIVPFVHDVRYIIENGLLFLMFLSGIFFQFDALDPAVRSVLLLNPMAILIESFREVLMYGGYPDFSQLTYVLVLSLVTAAIAVTMLLHYDRRYPKVL